MSSPVAGRSRARSGRDADGAARRRGRERAARGTRPARPASGSPRERSPASSIAYVIGTPLDAVQVQRVHQDGPVHLLPLHEQPAAVGVLLLDDPHELDLAPGLTLSRACVPTWHVLAAARSPGGELVQQDLPPAELARSRAARRPPATGRTRAGKGWPTRTGTSSALGARGSAPRRAMARSAGVRGMVEGNRIIRARRPGRSPRSRRRTARARRRDGARTRRSGGRWPARSLRRHGSGAPARRPRSRPRP